MAVIETERASALTKELHSDAAEAAVLLDLHHRIQAQGITLLEQARELGDRLVRQKAKLAHGGWSQWVDQFLPEMGQRQAGNYMRIATQWEQLQAYVDGDDTPSLRGAIAYLSDAQDLPSLEELAALWEPIGRIGKSGRRKRAFIVEAHDDTFAQRYSFPKLFPGRKALKDHWEQFGQTYLDGLARVKAERIAPVAPVSPVSDRPVSPPLMAAAPAAVAQDAANPARIYRDGTHQELTVGDRVMLVEEPDCHGTVQEFVVSPVGSGGTPRPIWVAWDDCQRDRRDGVELHKLVERTARFGIGEYVKGVNARGDVVMGVVVKVGYTTGWLRDAEGTEHPFKMAEVEAMPADEIQDWLEIEAAASADRAIAKFDWVCMVEDESVWGEVVSVYGDNVTVDVELRPGSLSRQHFALDQLRRLSVAEVDQIRNGVSDSAADLELVEPGRDRTRQERHHDRMTTKAAAEGDEPTHDENYTHSHLWQPLLDEWGRSEFDLDFATANGSPVPARVRITKELDMFRHPWDCQRDDGGDRLCFGNPPFSLNDQWSKLFLQRLGQDIFDHAFIVEKADSRTQWHQRLLNHCTAVCRVYNSQKFINPANLERRAGATFAIDLFYFGDALPRFARACRGLGMVMVPYTTADVEVTASCD